MTISVYVTEDDRKEIEQYADRLRVAGEDRRSRSRAIRVLLREGLKNVNRLVAVK